MSVRKLLLLIVIGCLPLIAAAELTIEITQGRDNPSAIAVVPFAWAGSALPEDVAAIVSADLQRSGQFAPVDRSDMLGRPHEEKEVFYRDWRALDVEYLVVGRILAHESGVVIRYELFDVFKQTRLMHGEEVGGVSALRDMAHRISDRVYEKLTGIRGAFSTRLLYVSAVRSGNNAMRYRLMISDADGARERMLREQSQPILTPSWSPDAKKVAYVSFETTRPAIFMENLVTGERTQLTNFKGLNGAPAWSPDGRRLALVLSKDGSPDIYTMDIASRQLTRVTDHYAIDTEPAWLPDGKSLVFTSDRGGKPQLYQVTLASGYVERLTYDGDYNARARVLRDGSGMIFVHRSNGEFHIALQNLRTGVVEVLTRTRLDESPSIAPNGTMVIYATLHQNKGVLAAVSVDGGVKYLLPSGSGDVREPDWSPFLH